MVRYWVIEGYESLERVFTTKVKVGCIGERQIRHLLRALAAKKGLDELEIVGAYASKGTKISNDLLEVTSNFEAKMLSCGTNPWSTATVVEE